MEPVETVETVETVADVADVAAMARHRHISRQDQGIGRCRVGIQ